MNLIEKLGCTPGPWEATGAYPHMIFHGAQLVADCSTNRVSARHIPENTDLIAAASEMLEALITFRDDISAEAEEESGIYIDDIIEKATGKTWAEVKELLK